MLVRNMSFVQKFWSCIFIIPFVNRRAKIYEEIPLGISFSILFFREHDEIIVNTTEMSLEEEKRNEKHKLNSDTRKKKRICDRKEREMFGVYKDIDDWHIYLRVNTFYGNEKVSEMKSRLTICIAIF